MSISGEKEEPPRHVILADSGGSIEFGGTVAATVHAPLEIEIAVESLPELVSAIRAGSPTISYHQPRLPAWVPRFAVWSLLFLLAQSALFYVYFLAHEAMSHGYNIELTIRAMKPSVTLKASKPKVETD